MKKNYHYSRKYRQLKYAVKQLKKNSKSNAAFTKQLILKIKRIVNGLKAVMATYRLKRLVAPALLVLGTSLQNPVEAQQFAEPVTNPFEITTDFPRLEFPTLVDLDGDGDLDLFAGSFYSYNGYEYDEYYSANFYYYENTGTASNAIFSDAKENPFGLQAGSYYVYPSFADLDNDGDMDLITGQNQSILFYENDGSATQPNFKNPLINPFGLKTDTLEYAFPTLSDLDNDGDLDILADLYDPVIYYENIGNADNPSFSEPITNPFGLAPTEYLSFSRFVDIDNDGDSDLIAGSTSYNYIDMYTYTYNGVINFYENIGNASEPQFLLDEDKTYSLEFSSYLNIPAIGDIDNDGDFDLLVNQYRGSTSYIENTGTANEPDFTTIEADKFELLSNQISGFLFYTIPEFADLDADGDFDLILGAANYSYAFNAKILYYENIGSDMEPIFSFPNTKLFENIVADTFLAPALSDIDNDEDLDILIIDQDGKILFAENTGSASNPIFENTIPNPFGFISQAYSTRIEFADLDNDEDEDFLFINENGNLTYYENTSGGGEILFAQSQMNPFNFEPTGDEAYITAVDFDNDGDIDLFAGTDNYELLHFENTGNTSEPQFAAPVADNFGFTQLPEYVIPTFADLDGDGDDDLISGSYYGSLFYYENIDSMPVNIAEIEQLNISIYPNPTNDIFYIDNFNKTAKVEILNTLGQTVLQFNTPKSSISLKELPAATYFIKITDVNGIQGVEKLLKQ